MIFANLMATARTTCVAYLFLCLMTRYAVGQTVASAPAFVQVTPYNQSCLQVDVTPPLNDGGQEVTAYEIQWDTEPGIREVQAISTVVNTGPNEIQVITTRATHTDEVQKITTSAIDMNEVQTIMVTSTLESDFGGSFTVVFDDSSIGGTAQESGPIMAKAEASAGDNGAAAGLSVEEILEGMQNIGDVNVTRVVVQDSQHSPVTKYSITYSITFLNNERDLPQLSLGTSQLTGAGADIVFGTTADGNMLGGNMLLTFNGDTSQPVPFDATPEQVKVALEALPSVDTVNVLRSGPDVLLGYVWTVTFTGDGNKGALPLIVGTQSGLTGAGANLTIALVTQGNQLGGSFDLTYPIGGDTGNTVSIPHDATDAALQNALENSLPNTQTGAIDVVRTGPDRNGGYAWTISFVGVAGNVADFTTSVGSLTGTGAAATSMVLHTGTDREIQRIALSNSSAVVFTFGSVSSGAMDATLGCTAPLKSTLEAMNTIGTVTTSCNDPGSGANIDWNVTFVSNAGDLPLLGTSDGNTVVTEITAGTSTKIGGKFTVEFDGQRTKYLPVTTSAAAMKTALESLSTVGSVDVSRSDVTENDGYIWSVTFQTELGDVPMMTTDSKAMTGTLPNALVYESTKGVSPPFNSTLGGTHPLNYDRMTDLNSLRYYIVYHQKDDYVEQLRQNVPYYVRVMAINSIGEGPFAVSSPRSVMPVSLPPSRPTDVQLHVIDGYSLNVSFNPPTHDHGKSIDKYKIEWDSVDIISEVQHVSIVSPVTNEVQVVRTVASDIDEVQVVRTVSSAGTATAVTEVQTISCNANGGSLKLSFNGQKTKSIAHDATATQIKSALESLSSVTAVSVSIANSQTTLCAASTPELVSVSFDSIPGLSGNMPSMTVDVSTLGGARVVAIAEATPGVAGIGGTFTLSFRGIVTEALPYAISDAAMITALTTLLGSAPSVTRTVVDGGQTDESIEWSITFTDVTLGGNIESLVVDSGGLTGNGAHAIVCADGDATGNCAGTNSISGNTIEGTFQLSLLGHTSVPIPYNASGKI